MANKNLFSSVKSLLPRANSTNEAGGAAYKLSPKHALAQIAATGCFNGVYYGKSEDQLATVKALAGEIDDNEFIAKLAIYARQRACMKDMPAALLVILSTRDTALMHRIFDQVVDNGRVLRTVFQMVRSGQFGRKGLSSSLQRAFRRWLNEASTGKLLSASIGNDPSLRDVMRMARPAPRDNERRALFGWLTEKETAKWAPASRIDLPAEVQALEAFRSADTEEAQALIAGDLRIRWDLLAGAAKGPLTWKAIARQMGPQALRMNLNTLMRHDVFGSMGGISGPGRKDQAMVDYVADRLADPERIRRSRQFPYQFLAAYLNASEDVPQKIKAALCEAAEIACGNVPAFDGPVVIGLDTSGSMQSPVSGWRGRGATTKMRCVDIAALFSAAVLRRNPDSVIVPFDTKAYKCRFDPQDSILSLAKRLAKYGGGGTDCSIPLREANTRFGKRRFAGVVLVSDSESWVYRGRPRYSAMRRSTGVTTEWQEFIKNQRRLAGRDPKLVCIDLQPYTTTQATERSDILNIGGFSDAVFNVVAAFLSGDEGRFVHEVESIELP